MLNFWSMLLVRDNLKNRLKTSRRRPRQSLVGNIELIEDRTLLSTFTVANTGDSGEGSLRQAILDANAQAGVDTIAFAINTGVQTIQPLTALPSITDPVTIDGTTQAGFNGTPLIVLNGSQLPAETFLSGLEINTTNSLIKGLVINGFSEGSAIVIGGFGSTGVMGNHVEGCYIGIDAAGTVAVPNSTGLRISSGATQNVLGGSGAAGNVISGNGFGVVIDGIGTSNNQILGNAIGTSADKSAAIGNGYGVGLGGGATGNNVGGTGAGEGNLISGNINNGILIVDANTANNKVLGNRIGTNAAGTASLGDFTTSAGIALQLGTHDNIIGGTTPGARNQIAGLSSDAIYIADSATQGNTIQGNYIGVSADGTTGIANGGDGIFIIDSSQNMLGGDGPAAANVISGNARHGITIFGASAINNVVWGNYIGTNATGTSDIPNASDGIRIDGASNNSIGGTTPAQANLISGNDGNGLTLTGPGAALNAVQGNLIGVAIDAITPLGNGINGIEIGMGASDNLIGGEIATAWNLIANNESNGIEVSDDTSLRNLIQGNRIVSNQLLGIDLNSDGVTANDALDADLGPNARQNFPVLNSVNAIGGSLFVSGTLNTKKNGTFTLQFYSSASDNGFGNSQGEVPVGTLQVSTDADGNAAFTAILSIVIAPGQVVTATTTDSVGNTSEFSASKLVGNSAPTSPILALPGDPLTYQLKQPAVVVDTASSVTDSDSANFNSGNLTVSFDSKGERGEKLKIQSQGTGPNQISIKGTKVLFGGIIIGKANGGGGGAGKRPLIVTLNENATQAAVTALLKRVTYSHTGKTTKLTTRTLRFQVTDDAGHASNVVNKLVTITKSS